MKFNPFLFQYKSDPKSKTITNERTLQINTLFLFLSCFLGFSCCCWCCLWSNWIELNIIMMMEGASNGGMLYHEVQESKLCAVHCVNTVLQGPFFSEFDLAALASDLDCKERQMMMLPSLASGDFLSHDSHNVSLDGDFSIQVHPFSFNYINSPFNFLLATVFNCYCYCFWGFYVGYLVLLWKCGLILLEFNAV